MPNVYVEARPKGCTEGSAIDDSSWKTTRTTCSRPSKHSRKQSRGLKKNNHSPLVARVRHLNDKKKADHWRSA
jgi:hypothetical protein